MDSVAQNAEVELADHANSPMRAYKLVTDVETGASGGGLMLIWCCSDYNSHPRPDGDTPRSDGDTPRSDGDTPLPAEDTPRFADDTPRSDGDTPRFADDTPRRSSTPATVQLATMDTVSLSSDM